MAGARESFGTTEVTLMNVAGGTTDFSVTLPQTITIEVPVYRGLVDPEQPDRLRVFPFLLFLLVETEGAVAKFTLTCPGLDAQLDQARQAVVTQLQAAVPNRLVGLGAACTAECIPGVPTQLATKSVTAPEAD